MEIARRDFGNPCAFKSVNLNSVECVNSRYRSVCRRHINGNCARFHQDSTMGIDENEKPVMSNCKTGTLLFVADFVTGSHDVLDFACELAERQNADLQLLHVIDPEHTHSSPDRSE